MTILEAAAALRAKKVSSAELTEEALKRIESANPKINAFITVAADSARARAAAMDGEMARGVDRGGGPRRSFEVLSATRRRVQEPAAGAQPAAGLLETGRTGERQEALLTTSQC